jgi:hypothetical protein
VIALPAEIVESSLAEQKFADAAKKFLNDCRLQYGVHIFMMAGYKDQSGKMLRTKCVAISCGNLMCAADASSTRIESPLLHPDNQTFLPIFQEVGGEVWTAYDKFLKDCAGQSLINLFLS